MKQNEFNHILGNIDALSPDQVRQLRRELDNQLAGAGRRDAAPQVDAGDPAADPILGCMRDDAELMDEIVADAYRRRREEIWRELGL
jgi:hypothetical protein